MALPEVLDPEDSFGLPKENYSEVRDPRKDFDFREYERLAVAVSMFSYTAPRAWAVISGAASAGAMVRDHRALWGETSAVVPTCTATATGTYVVTFPASVTDLNPTASRATTTALDLKTALVTLHGPGMVNATCAANVVTVYTATTGGVATSNSFAVFGF